MVDGFSSIRITVPDLNAALKECAWLFGEQETDSDHALLPLANVAIALQEDAGIDAPRISGLVLWSQHSLELPVDIRHLHLSVAPDRQVTQSGTGVGIDAVDHIVLRTGDADDCIRLFGEDLGMRLALDQEVPEWGGRMLFFRCGKLTLEVIQNLDKPVSEDHFWGITYLCRDLDATIERLDQLGVAHSPIRDGRKPGTRVATVKSHTLGIPTLLIEPAAAS